MDQIVAGKGFAKIFIAEMKEYCAVLIN
jgi:hypothetical protein